MKLTSAVVVALVGMTACTDASKAPMFRARYAGSRTPLCLNADATGPTLKKCDDLSPGQQWMLNGKGDNVVGVSSMATVQFGESDVMMNRTPINTYTIEFGGQCYGKGAKMVTCPKLKVSGKGKAAKKANNKIKQASFYIEPLLSIPGMEANCDGDAHAGHDHSGGDAHAGHDHSDHSGGDDHAGHDSDGGHSNHDGHDHSMPNMSSMSSFSSSWMPAGHSADDGHDHSMPTMSSFTNWMPAGHSADDGHDHSGAHSDHDGHDHSAPATNVFSSWMPAGHSADDGHDHSAPVSTRPSFGNCRVQNGKVVCN